LIGVLIGDGVPEEEELLFPPGRTDTAAADHIDIVPALRQTGARVRSHDVHDDNNHNFHLVAAICIPYRVFQMESMNQ
jgi:hypothetical protein